MSFQTDRKFLSNIDTKFCRYVIVRGHHVEGSSLKVKPMMEKWREGESSGEGRDEEKEKEREHEQVRALKF